MNTNVFRAIFKRNFVSYFSSPTGYVFICVFVLLSSFAAFWPNEFFNSNLANLDQLNRYFPYIMLVFIPAITMSIWSEERRQGTDELLLTIPATDLDVVLGKYVASLAIFSVALLFSMFSNFCILNVLGRPDPGLFLGTYVGYWMIGLAMLAVGMVASFFTSNLTVGFILGAIFNAPLAFSSQADVIIKQPEIANAVRQWTLASQFSDFERGVVSLSSVSYFVMIAVVMLYLSVVLIGRRHWSGGRDGSSMLQHYAVRTLSLVVLAVGVNFFLSNHDLVRADITSERLSSLSPDTRRLIRELETSYPVQIEAYVSPNVPAEYVQTKLNLLSMLDELASLGDGKIQVRKHLLENYTDQAVLAEQKYNIKPQVVLSKNRGARTQEEIYLGVALTCGLEKVVLPFVDKGLPAEYELVRSICTVAQQDRKRVGVLKTDAQLIGGINMQTMSPSQDQMIIEELRKQYEVVEVDPTSPITDRYDVLLAVQPSSLTPEQMTNFVDVVKSGQPTAIFEDPFPVPQFWQNVAGTAQPRQQQQNPLMMFGQPPAQPKGDLSELWRTLGVDLAGDEIIWQDYNPYPKSRDFVTPEWVFIDGASGTSDPFGTDAISAGLQQVLFLYPGSLRKLNASQLEFTPLATTGRNTGTIQYGDLMNAGRAGQSANLAFARMSTQERYVIAAHIRGTLPTGERPTSRGLIDEPAHRHDHDHDHEGHDHDHDHAQFPVTTEAEVCEDDDATADTENVVAENSVAENADAAKADAEKADAKPAAEKEAPPQAPEVNVVLVSDIDCLVSAFFALRARGEDQDDEIQWDFDNVTFVLNTLDSLAGDDRFIEIRKRRRPHRTLENVEERTEQARQEAAEQREEFNKKYEAARAEEQNKFGERIAELEKRQDLDPVDRQIQIEIARRDGQRRLDIRLAQLQQERDRELQKIERALALEIRSVQDSYKLWAVMLPPLPPLLLAFFVFFHRRQQEREGVSKSRLR